MAPPTPWGFVNPPDMLEEDWGNFAGNPQYPMDFVVNLVWRAPVGLPLSIRLYQINMTSGQAYDPFDYILQSVVNRTEHEWRVSVDPMEQDLAVSNVFFLSLFWEGQMASVGTSQYFNISRRKTDDDGDSTGGLSSTTSPGARTSTSAGLGTTLLNTATPMLPSPTDDATRAPAASSGNSTTTAAAAAAGMPAAATIGLAVGIPLAIILGLLAGWLLFRRRRQAQDPRGPGGQPPPPPHYYAHYQHPALVPDPTKQPPPLPGELPGQLPGQLPGPQTCEVSVHNYGGHRYELDAPAYDRQARGGLG